MSITQNTNDSLKLKHTKKNPSNKPLKPTESSHSLSLSVSVSFPLALTLSFPLTSSLHLTPSCSVFASLCPFLPQTLILDGSTCRDSISTTNKDYLSLSLFLATDSIKSKYMLSKLYLYYESPSHYFEVLFLVLTYHMFRLHYVFM